MVGNVTAHHMEWTVAVCCVAVEATIHSDWLHGRNVNVNFIGVVLCTVKHVFATLRCIHVNRLKEEKKKKHKVLNVRSQNINF